ncbi:hypothetical protein RIF29_38929 [Crotalaria pallida]|uniref:Uncharacterized protein n=1 Tax=Crotalaria pallida TaxID=3830 RepID=A0AAN9HPD1_CROPI
MMIIVGNPLVCATGKEPNCHGITLMPMSMNLNNTEDALPSGRPKTHKMAIVFGLSLDRMPLPYSSWFWTFYLVEAQE